MGEALKVLTNDQWLANAKELYGDNPKQWVFRCPGCKETQTGQEFIDAGIENAKGKFYYSCIGRWVEGRGCDWTLGGLFKIHTTEVIDEDGNNIPVMEFADIRKEPVDD